MFQGGAGCTASGASGVSRPLRGHTGGSSRTTESAFLERTPSRQCGVGCHPGNGGGGVTAHLQARGEGTGCTSAWEAPGGPPGTRISEKHQLMAGRLVGQTEVFL